MTEMANAAIFPFSRCGQRNARRAPHRSAAISLMSKRELIDTRTDKRYIGRDENGKFKQSVDVGRSLSADKGSACSGKVIRRTVPGPVG
ncbi:hypothetical protein E9677_01770 [Rhizobium rhizophilum]|uniref:Uncharacterized protein n=1 Tax=Rhizobium rhizophilum TaxID=1850373 RepID=A0ABY2QYZ7_9HYPH|nr:hypothetical protein E9677_01770 [Rhizobium rhizophilum]